MVLALTTYASYLQCDTHARFQQALESHAKAGSRHGLSRSDTLTFVAPDDSGVLT